MTEQKKRGRGEAARLGWKERRAETMQDWEWRYVYRIYVSLYVLGVSPPNRPDSGRHELTTSMACASTLRSCTQSVLANVFIQRVGPDSWLPWRSRSPKSVDNGTRNLTNHALCYTTDMTLLFPSLWTLRGRRWLQNCQSNRTAIRPAGRRSLTATLSRRRVISSVGVEAYVGIIPRRWLVGCIVSERYHSLVYIPRLLHGPCLLPVGAQRAPEREKCLMIGPGLHARMRCELCNSNPAPLRSLVLLFRRLLPPFTLLRRSAVPHITPASPNFVFQ